MITFPNCKINLGLHIHQKRKDGFHDIETIFYPIALRDGLEIIQSHSSSTEIEFTDSGAVIGGSPSDNICVKAYHLLKKDFAQLPHIEMHLHKTIPAGAGLGGGSADGAFTLLLLNKKFRLGVSEAALAEYALKLGSDCPFFIKNAPCYATGRGEVLEEISLDLSAYKIVLVNPGIHINTAWAFLQITPSKNQAALKEIITQPVEKWKGVLKNDFEEPVSLHHPQIKETKNVLYEMGAIYSSMTGSGSTVFGIFLHDAAIPVSFPPHYFVKII